MAFLCTRSSRPCSFSICCSTLTRHLASATAPAHRPRRRPRRASRAPWSRPCRPPPAAAPIVRLAKAAPRSRPGPVRAGARPPAPRPAASRRPHLAASRVTVMTSARPQRSIPSEPNPASARSPPRCSSTSSRPASAAVPSRPAARRPTSVPIFRPKSRVASSPALLQSASSASAGTSSRSAEPSSWTTPRPRSNFTAWDGSKRVWAMALAIARCSGTGRKV